MKSIQLTEKCSVSNFTKPYVIAELGSNHNGDMKLARKMIMEAQASGADCVKFQSWSKETIFAKEKYEENCFLADDYRDRTDYTLEEIVEEYSISEQELLEMKNFCDGLGIDCTSTPFSPQEVDFLVDKLKTPFIKVASMDLNNIPFLKYIARKNLPIVISTGLSSLSEIDNAILAIEEEGNKEIVILHCVSLYPPDDNQVNLNNIKTLMSLYPYPVGFSDHTIGSSIPIASVALGSCLIEKHFTLDKNLPGWDHKVSATPDELKEIVESSIRVSSAMGSHRISTQENEERRKEFRRSIVLKKRLTAGDTLKEDDLDFKRPGHGVSPDELKYVLGRTLKVDKGLDSVLSFSDLI